MNLFLLRIASLCLCVFALVGCSDVTGVPPQTSPTFTEEQMKPVVLNQATEFDKTVVDGYFFGQEPRLFKTGYRKTAPEQKANFAMAYHKMIADSGQNMVRLWSSYLPYSKRRDFARQWWNDPAHDPEYAKQESKYKTLWLHEAIMDAGELWWRAYEKLANDKVAAPLVLAHDAEQGLISKYAEAEHHEGTFSSQPKE